MSAERRINLIQGHLAGTQPSQPVVEASSCQAAPKSPKGVSRHGGDLAAQALVEQGVKLLFTLTGGHIAPILTGANQAGIRVIDVRDEATAVFAADAVSRMVGVPGVAVVTAGPGLTNTITAVKNAQLAQSPVVVFAGATSMLLKGRGSLQDIDQFALMKPHCKLMIGIKALNQIIPAIRKAFRVAQEGVPGPVFIEYPLEVLWPRDLNETTLGLGKAPPPLNWSNLSKAAVMQRVQSYYLQRHMDNVFENAFAPVEPLSSTAVVPKPPSPSDVQTVFNALAKATRPVILVGSQAVRAREAAKLAASLVNLGAPVYLSGMGRGLLGKENRIQMRHKRGVALAKADFILLAGVPADFRLNYGRDLNKSAFFATVNLCAVTLRKNNDLRKPDLLVHGDALNFLVRLADLASGRSADLYKSWSEWFKELQKQQEKREQEINKMAEDEKKAKALIPNAPDFVSPIALCRAIDQALDDDSIIVADGGDFVGTASYIVRPRGPLSWLDPGVFGTLGVGGGFLAGAKAVRPASEVWALYGDGAAGWSLAEFDTYVRHKLPIIAVIGNDACWSQMYRDQIKMLKDAVATELAYTHYEEVARGFGAEGILVTKESEIFEALQKAKRLAREGKPVLVNVLIAKSGFREGSISL